MTQVTHNSAELPPDLNLAEEKLVGCVKRGVQCKVGENGEFPEEEIKSGNAVNVVRGEVIRYLALTCGGNRENPVLGGVINLRGAWISGYLNLSHANIPVTLGFTDCHFAVTVHMLHMECHGLYMNRCHLSQGLVGYGMKTKGSVFLRHVPYNVEQVSFSAKGEVQLVGVHIGGDLDCRGGEFDNPKGYALNADRITVKGDVHLSSGFSAEGEVRFLGADIGGQLDCAGGLFVNEGDSKYALNAERAKIGGHVYLNQHKSRSEEPFTADGRVRFANANIGGNFNCKGGQFNHSGERSALAAGGLRSRAVFLSGGFSIRGEVALHVAHIGNFVCTGCVPNNQSPTIIRLSSTKAAAVDDAKKSWKPFKFILDGFTYDTFYDRSPTDSRTRLKWLAKRPKKIRLKNGKMAELPFSPLPYEQAAKVLFGMGHGGDAREILLKKERRQTADKRTPLLRKILRKMWDIFAGYGYRLRRPLCWMTGFFLFGAFVFGVAGSHNLIAPHQPAILASKEYQQELKSEESRIKAVRKAFPEYPEFSPLVFSLDVFVPLFVLHQEPFWSPISKGGRNWKEMSFLIAFVLAVLVIMCRCAWLFQHWCERDDDHAPKFAWAMIGLAFFSLAMTLAAATGLASMFFGAKSVVWLFHDGWLFKVWYWLEIGAGWVLTSLFLLSITGLLRPRQSSGEKS